jgi:hypothetical protein
MNVDDIPGFLQAGAAAALTQAAVDVLQRHVTGDFVEVGSFKGKSTVVLATVLRQYGDNGRRLHAIDPHEGILDWTQVGSITTEPTLDAFLETIRTYGVERWVTPHVGTVDTFELPVRIALAFIDGLHDFNSVLHDAGLLLPAMSPGGLMCFHDYAPDWPGVMAAVDEFEKTYNTVAYRHVIDTLAVLQLAA